MKYLYYPGCSLKSTAQEYDISTHAVLAELGVELVELDDWTCCGASAAETASELLSFVLPARNLALAERASGGQQLVASCSACYVNLQKVNAHIEQDSQLLDRINEALSVDGLEYKGTIQVRHLLDVITNDIGPEAIAAKAVIDRAQDAAVRFVALALADACNELLGGKGVHRTALMSDRGNCLLRPAPHRK